MSDHSAINLTVYLTSRERNTIWRLNVGLLNNKVWKKSRDIITYREENGDGEVDPTILW